MRTAPAHPAPAPPASTRRTPLRAAAALAAGVLLLALLAALCRELILARVPAQRAQLERLIREQTGLEVSFVRLTVGWGWYGPQAVFEQPAFGEPGAPALVRAERLIVGIDTWRSLRTGGLEAGRVRLLQADIDLDNPGAAVRPARADAPPLAARLPVVLNGWRGGRIDAEGLRLHLPHGFMIQIPHADLRRRGAVWSAQARLVLPPELGEHAELALSLTGDITRRGTLSGTFAVNGARLSFAGWQRLGLPELPARYLPRGGSGTLDLEAAIAAGRLARVAGRLAAVEPRWAPRLPGGRALELARLDADWQLTRLAGGTWRLALGRLDLGAAAAGAALLELGPHAVRGNLGELPLAAVSRVLEWGAPQLVPALLQPEGALRQISFDWDPTRAPGERLAARARLQQLALAAPDGAVRLEGLGATITLTDTQLAAELDAGDAALTLPGATPAVVRQIQAHGRLVGFTDGTRWGLATRDLELRSQGGLLRVRGSLGARPHADPQLDLRVQLVDFPAALGAALLGDAVARPDAGRITHGELAWQGALLAAAPRLRTARSRGELAFAGVSLPGDAHWPAFEDLDGRLEWRDARLRAQLSRARSGSLRLTDAEGTGDVGGAGPLRLRAHLEGDAGDALAWLRARPQFAPPAPLLSGLRLEGRARLELELTRPAVGPRSAAPRARLNAALENVQLEAAGGLPPLRGVTGTLAFSDGHLRDSTLRGTWLGGPVALTVRERPQLHGVVLSVGAHGSLAAAAALALSGGSAAAVPLSGSAEWSGRFTAGGDGAWQLHAESSLVGLASGLPEPLGKPAGAPLPLRLEAEGEGERAQVHLALGVRLNGVLALARAGTAWRIGGGALRLDGTAAGPAPGPLLSIEGHLSRLDLPAYLALWQRAAHTAVLPPLSARVSAGEVSLDTRLYPQALVTAQSAASGGQLTVQARQLEATLTWPGPDSARNTQLHLASFEPTVADAAALAALPQACGRAVQVVVDEVRAGGRVLGALSATVAAVGPVVKVSALHLGGGAHELHGAGQCTAEGECAVHFGLESRDPAALLAASGLRVDLGAARASLSGDLTWPRGTDEPLATLRGHLHMILEQGVTRVASETDSAPPFALFLAPALIDGMTPQGPGSSPQARTPDLGFTRLTADYELREGVASTTNLHFDGDAEMLVRARVGLVRRDYDGEAVVLRGEERLPAALRGFGATPRVAALWLSLRQWFTGGGDRGRTVLRLRGDWNDPIVAAAE